MTINGKYYSEPEALAYIKGLEAACKRYEDENSSLSEKLDNLGADYNAQVSVIGFLEQDNKKFEDLLREVRPVLRAAFFAHYEQTNKANELYDKIVEIVGKE